MEAVSSEPKFRPYLGQQKIFELPLGVRGILDVESRLPVSRVPKWFGGCVIERVSWACPGVGGGGEPVWILALILYHQFSFLIFQKTELREDVTNQ